jgi:hypothetical protein
MTREQSGRPGQVDLLFSVFVTRTWKDRPRSSTDMSGFIYFVSDKACDASSTCSYPCRRQARSLSCDELAGFPPPSSRLPCREWAENPKNTPFNPCWGECPEEDSTGLSPEIQPRFLVFVIPLGCVPCCPDMLPDCLLVGFSAESDRFR